MYGREWLHACIVKNLFIGHNRQFEVYNSYYFKENEEICAH